MSIISRVFPHTSSKQSKLGQKDATGIQQVKVTVTPMMGFHAKEVTLLGCPYLVDHFRITSHVLGSFDRIFESPGFSFNPKKPLTLNQLNQAAMFCRILWCLLGKETYRL